MREVLARGRRPTATATSYAGADVNLEFVSANPTGPLHLGGTRWAAVGDALGRVLAARGAKVTREYYFNDAGAQIDRFVDVAGGRGAGRAHPRRTATAAPTSARSPRRSSRPSPGALELPARSATRSFRRVGVDLMFDRDQADAARLRHRLRRVVPRAVAARFRRGRGRRSSGSRSPGNLYFADGAWWLRSTE